MSKKELITEINFDQVSIDGEIITVNSPTLLNALIKAPEDTLKYLSVSLKDIDIDKDGYIIIKSSLLAASNDLATFSKHSVSSVASNTSQLSVTVSNQTCHSSNIYCP